MAARIIFPACSQCGSTEWIARRHETVFSEASSSSTGRPFSDEETVDGELEDLRFLCADCRRDAEGDIYDELTEIYRLVT